MTVPRGRSHDPILQMRKLKLEEIESLAQGCTGRFKQSHDWHSGPPAPNPEPILVCCPRWLWGEFSCHSCLGAFAQGFGERRHQKDPCRYVWVLKGGAGLQVGVTPVLACSPLKAPPWLRF